MKKAHLSIYSTARPPTIAAPTIPHAAVSRGAAPAVEVGVAAPDPLGDDPAPLWPWPSAVDSLALRAAAAPENGVALTPVLFLQLVGLSFWTVLEKVMSAHCGDVSQKRRFRWGYLVQEKNNIQRRVHRWDHRWSQPAKSRSCRP